MDLKYNLAQMVTLIKWSVVHKNHIFNIKGVVKQKFGQHLVCLDSYFTINGNVNIDDTGCSTEKSYLYTRSCWQRSKCSK